jgi:hypothetical protein
MYEDDFTLTFTDEPYRFREELVVPYFDDRVVPGNIPKPLTHVQC